MSTAHCSNYPHSQLPHTSTFKRRAPHAHPSRSPPLRRRISRHVLNLIHPLLHIRLQPIPVTAVFPLPRICPAKTASTGSIFKSSHQYKNSSSPIPSVDRYCHRPLMPRPIFHRPKLSASNRNDHQTDSPPHNSPPEIAETPRMCISSSRFMMSIRFPLAVS